jgi:hypothetical protein
MANFALSLIDPVTGAADIQVSGGVISISDHSNYDDVSPEAAHARSNFSDFYKIKIVEPNLVEYWYSSIGDGNGVVITPSAGSAGDPSVDYDYAAGDGQYWIYIYAVPTYSVGASYLITTFPYVYYNAKIWKALQSSSGQVPVEGAYWTEVTDLDELSAKYRLAQRIVVYAEMKRCYARRVYNSNILNNRIGENWEKLLKDPEFIDAVRLFIAINSIPVLMAADDFTSVDTNINFGKQIASKY